MTVTTKSPDPNSISIAAPNGSMTGSNLPAAFSQPPMPQRVGPAEPPVFNLQVRRSLRMHKKLAIAVGAAISLAVLTLGLLQPKTYTASSVVYVEPIETRNLNQVDAPGFDQFRYGSFLDQQMQTVVRQDVLTAALRSLPAGIWRGPKETEQSAISRLAKALTVERVLTSYQVTIQLKSDDPNAAAAIVNAVTTTYLKRGREDEFKQDDLRAQLLTEERTRVQQELDTERKEQAALGASMGLASPSEGAGNPFDSDLSALRGQLAAARQARDVAAAQLASVTGQDADHHSGLAAEADDAINTDAGLSAKKAAVNARKVVLETLIAGLTPSNPQYRQAQDEIADLDRSLDAKSAEVRAQVERRVQDKLRVELRRSADVESRVNALLAEGTAKATSAGPKLQRAAELNFDIQRLTARYTTVDNALNALQVETSGPGMAHLVLPAMVPVAPDPGHGNLFFLAAIPLGLFCGVVAAVAARRFDPRIYLSSDLQDVIGFAPMAVLPAREEVSERMMDEYILRLAAGVESARRTAEAQSIIITAVSAETDTSTLLRDLARKLEALRLRVLVLPASELLITSKDTIEHRVAQQGDGHEASTRLIQTGEGIASAKLDRRKHQYDIILIHAAPVLHSAETEYAARCADGTILVAESGVTLKAELIGVTTLLSRLRVNGVGAVLYGLHLEQADASFRHALHVLKQRHLHQIDHRGQMPADLPPNEAAAHRSPADTFTVSTDDSALGQSPVVASELTDAESSADLHAVGRLITDNDEAGAVSAETISKIRLAFQEQEVNSKTKWFKKLFRGEAPGSFRVIPDQEDVEGEDRRQDRGVERSPESRSDSDRELTHLISRIKMTDEANMMERAHAVLTPDAEETQESIPPLPFFERRSPSRLVDTEEYEHPESIVSASELSSGEYSFSEARTPANPSQDSSMMKNLQPVETAPLPLSTSAMQLPAVPQLPSESLTFDRPLRPLTFHQLARTGNLNNLPEQMQPEEGATPAIIRFPTDVVRPEKSNGSPVVNAAMSKPIEHDAFAGYKSDPLGSQMTDQTKSEWPLVHDSSIIMSKPDLTTDSDAFVAPLAVSSAGNPKMHRWPEKESSPTILDIASRSSAHAEAAPSQPSLNARSEGKIPASTVASSQQAMPSLSRPWKLLSTFEPAGSEHRPPSSPANLGTHGVDAVRFSDKKA